MEAHRSLVLRIKKDKMMIRRMFAVVLCILIAGVASALPYREARDRAWFLTDKMAYELGLTEEQYDCAYQINLDYLLSIDRADDCHGVYWRFRNTDLRYILTEAQYRLYATISYFLYPVQWVSGKWYYPVVRFYRPTVFYFSRPRGYLSYGGHRWHGRRAGAPSPYHNFRPGHPGRPGHRPPAYQPPARPHRPAVRPERPEHRPGRPAVRPERPAARTYRPAAKPQRPSIQRHKQRTSDPNTPRRNNRR